MIRLLVFLFLLICVSSHAQKKIELTGKIYGKSIVINTFSPSDTASLCIDSIVINGKKQEGNIPRIYEIPLDSLNIRDGDSANIIIFHKKDCTPKIRGIIHGPLPSFNCHVIQCHLSKEGEFTWTAIQEEQENFIIKQVRWKKWVTIGEVKGQSRCDTCHYTFQIPNMHSGNNVILLCVYNYDADQVKYGYEKDHINLGTRSVKSHLPRVSYSYNSSRQKISFSDNTFFELLNINGIKIKEGYSNEIICKGLPKGKYFLNFDNRTKKIELK